jgi:glucosylceramidase
VTSNATPADAPLAADDDASTAWRSGSPQAAGQWLQVDLGARKHLRSLVLDAGPSTYGWQSDGSASTEGPAAWRAEVSSDGTHWTTASTGTGGGQLTRVPLPAGAERYVRVVLTGTAAGQWQVAEVRPYS